MDDTGRKQNDFVGYDYKEVTAEGARLSLLLDGYENFGWEVDQRAVETVRTGKAASPIQKTALRLKRNRKIINKVELTRLERNFEACVDEIDKLEKEKTTQATMYALILGITGAAFMAGSVFAVTASPPSYIWCIILAIPGFLGWIFPYFLYKKVVGRQTERVAPLVEMKYDEIYELCEKGNKLLH